MAAPASSREFFESLCRRFLADIRPNGRRAERDLPEPDPRISALAVRALRELIRTVPPKGAPAHRKSKSF